MNTSRMVPWTFALDSTDQLADFIEYHGHFLPPDQRRPEERAYDYATVATLQRASLYRRALELGRASWGARQALADFLKQAGKIYEQEALLQAARPTTGVLLARLMKRYPDASLDELLEVPEATFALHDAERTELLYLRPEIWITLWDTHGSSLRTSQYAHEREAAFFESRLLEERQRLEKMSNLLREKHQQKLDQLEERVFLRGERVDVSIWDA